MRARGAAPAVLVGALALSVLVGCSGDDGDEAGSGRPSGSTTADPTPVRTRVEVGQVPGRLAPKARERAADRVGKVVDRWFDAAYVGGDYPRRDFGDAFPGFTRGAAAEARRDKALMTNAPLGRRVDEVRATGRRVWVDLLPAGGRAAAATARFRLAFTTSGEVSRDVVVRGRLMLAPGAHGWQVFAYDVAKGSPQELAPPSARSGGKPGGKKPEGKTSRGKKHRRGRHGDEGGKR